MVKEEKEGVRLAQMVLELGWDVFKVGKELSIMPTMV